jgi:cell division protein FtsB
MHPQIYKLVLNNPCKEDWNTMGIIEGGRHCEQCSKDVIDFSSYSKEAIIDFFVANQGKGICGRMKKSQMNAIEIDRHLLDYNISFWKKFLIIFLIVFGYELFGASFVFAQVVESDTVKQEKIETKIVDTLRIDSLTTDSTIENGIGLTDSTSLLEAEREKLKAEIKQLEKEISKIDLAKPRSKFPDFKLEKIILTDMIYGYMAIVPSNDLKPIIFVETKSDDSIKETKTFKNSIINRDIIPLHSKHKTPKSPDQKNYPLTFILPDEKQFKIGEDEI